MRRALLLAAVAWLTTGCVRRAEPDLPAPTSDWPQVLGFAQNRAANGDFASADSALAAFARRRADSPEAREAGYWRAVINLDPHNPARDQDIARTALERFVTDTSAGWPHGPQARALLSLMAAADSLDVAATRLARAAADSVRDTPAAPARDSAKEDELQKEVQRLKEQLERANAELDLIRKRLTAPRRPSGTPATRP